MKFVKGPDFPTGGIIMGRDGIRDAYETGRGSIKIRAVCSVEEGSAGRARIVVSELPYQVNKARLAEKIAELVKSGKVKDIADLKDHSSGRAGMRLVIDLKRGANPQVVLNQLYKHTQLQESFGVIMLALVDGVPRTLNLAEMIGYYVDHQIDVVTRRTRYDLRKAEERDHIVQGLLIALDHLDEVIKVIRGSQDAEQARTKLMSKFKLSEIQANHILDMPLRRLTKLARTELEEEHKELLAKIKYLKALLKDPKKIRGVIKEEILQIKQKHGDPRRTQIKADEGSFDIEDLIAEEDVVITVSRAGYVKRVPDRHVPPPRQGGKGVRGATLKEEDVVANVFTTTTHNWLLFFTTKGKVYRVKVHEVPDASRIARGLYAANLPGVAISGDEGVSAVLHLKEYDPKRFLLFATKKGMVKKTPLPDYESARTGLAAINLKPGDELIDVKLTDGKDEVFLVSRKGQAIRFKEHARAPDGAGHRRRDRDAAGRGRRGDLAQPRLRRRGDDQRLAAGLRQALAAEGLPREGARREGRDRPPDHEEDGPARRRVRRLEGARSVRDLLERDRDPGAGRRDPQGRAVEPGRPHDARRGGRPRRRDRTGDHADGGVAHSESRTDREGNRECTAGRYCDDVGTPMNIGLGLLVEVVAFLAAVYVVVALRPRLPRQTTDLVLGSIGCVMGAGALLFQQGREPRRWRARTAVRGGPAGGARARVGLQSASRSRPGCKSPRGGVGGRTLSTQPRPRRSRNLCSNHPHRRSRSRHPGSTPSRSPTQSRSRAKRSSPRRSARLLPKRRGRPRSSGRPPRRGCRERGVRRTRVEIRRVGPVSVLKFSLIFYFCVFLVVYLALAIIWGILSASGVIDSLEQLLGIDLPVGHGLCRRPASQHRRGAADRDRQRASSSRGSSSRGCVGVAIWSCINVFVAVMYNLISDIVGGVEVTLADRRD